MNYAKDFPIFKRKIHGKQLVYLDSAATTQKPQKVIDALTDFYTLYNANPHRGLYTLSEEATALYEKARETIAAFIGADASELVFTKSCTEALNIVAHAYREKLAEGDEILISSMEHHSNLIPWQELAKDTKAVLRFIALDKEGNLDFLDFTRKLSLKTKVISLTTSSNVLGTQNPVKKIIEYARAHTSAIVVLDAAQSVGTTEIDVKKIDVDLLAFSGHKMFAPTGIGCLYGKQELLESMRPMSFGGGMVADVQATSTQYSCAPHRFEAGTPPVANAVALAHAVEYIQRIGVSLIEKHIQNVTNYLSKRLLEIPGITVYGPPNKTKVVSFNVAGIHAHDLATLLDEYGVAIRAGNHCCMPLMRELKVSGTARASLHLYNTPQDIDILINAVRDILTRVK